MRLDPITLSITSDEVKTESRCNQNLLLLPVDGKLITPQRVASSPTVMSDDHSELVPLLPIPNRTVKRLCADDSVRPYVKVGHRQTPYKHKSPPREGFCVYGVRCRPT